MSSYLRSVLQISQDQWVQFTNNVALEAPEDFLFRQALTGAPGNIFAGTRVASHSHQGNGLQGIVRLPVAPAVEPVTTRFSGRCLQGTDAAQGGQGGFVA